MENVKMNGSEEKKALNELLKNIHVTKHLSGPNDPAYPFAEVHDGKVVRAFTASEFLKHLEEIVNRKEQLAEKVKYVVKLDANVKKMTVTAYYVDGTWTELSSITVKYPSNLEKTALAAKRKLAKVIELEDMINKTLNS